jgi:hypothetical protein
MGDREMAVIDVFNGDADGICALQQLRLEEPVDGTLVTGVKRDIALLQRVDAASGDRVQVLDISLDKNRTALVELLGRGAQVTYYDHHYPGEIPQHPALEAHIDTRPDVGTCWLVDRHLGGSQRAWAVVGTFGDNFDATARALAEPLGLGPDHLARLRDLGIYINYNGYGSAVEDLHFPPDGLYRRLRPYADPLDFIREDDTFARLEAGYRDDMARADGLAPEVATDRAALYRLPAAPWARRVGGVLANRLAQEARGRAHALLTERDDGDFVVSVRAPLDHPAGADELCREFPTGGGRQAAAGVNRLPAADYDRFAARFLEHFGG